MGRYRELLHVHPSFLEGLGRLVDFAGTLDEDNQSVTGDEADRVALLSDWYAIGDDLREVISNFAQRHGLEIIND